MRLILALLAASVATAAIADQPITITFLHTNDLHAHVEPTVIRKQPYGGYARLATLANQIRSKEKNVLLLNAGDTFQGTLYFNTYEGLADLAIMNAMHYDAATIGNHEFDRGPATLATFMKGATFPIVSANIDASADKDLGPILKPYTILTVGGETVGVVGATTPDTSNISSPGPTIKFSEPYKPVQEAVDELTKQGINKIVLVTHIGYDEDLALVTKLHNVDLVIGGHSHTPLGTPALDGWGKAQGPYPTIAKDAEGVSVPVVQCYEWGKVFGEIKLSFDGNGKVTKIVEAHPIVVDQTIPEDPLVKSIVAAYRKPIEAQSVAQIGVAVNAVPKEANATGESLMADVLADGMLAATAKSGSVAAFVNSGGVRGSLEQGKITFANLISISPFGNTLTLLTLTGQELQDAIQEGIGTGGLLNPSHGTSYKVTGGKVESILVAGQPLDLTKNYQVTFYNFTANGGDKHVVLQNAKGRRVDTGLLDIDALTDFVKSHTPLDVKAEGRIERG